MSCIRESSPLQDYYPDGEKNVATKRRFWNPKKWFRRRNNKISDDAIVVEVTETSTTNNKDSLRSRSASELSATDEGRRKSSASMHHPGLSVSHDSIFHSNNNSVSDMELDAAQSSSSLSISQPHIIDSRILQTELIERLRVRRGRGDVSEDDEGFPNSSCNSPTASDGLLLDKTAIKDLPTKSHSTCSDGSLLSMASYEMDEVSSDPQSRHSSKLSLHEKKLSPDSYSEFIPSSSLSPLNHSAAHHRVAVKPKRTHGAPRRKRGAQLSAALPATPEVNEDSSIRSVSPDINKKEMLTELYSMSSNSCFTSRTLTETQIKCSSLPPGLTAPPSAHDSSDTTTTTPRLNRSKSNAGGDGGSHNQADTLTTTTISVHEVVADEKEEKLSLFDRIFPRKSGRKKKQKEDREVLKQQVTTTTTAKDVVESTQKIKAEVKEDEKIHESIDEHDRRISMKKLHHMESSSSATTTTSIQHTTMSPMTSMSESKRYEPSKPIPAPRSGPASRQRIQPMDIPSTPDELRRDAAKSSSPEIAILLSSSPLHAELENRFKQRQISLTTSSPLSSSPVSSNATLSDTITTKSPQTSPRIAPRRTTKHSSSPILPTVISSKLEYSTHYNNTRSYSSTNKFNELIKQKQNNNNDDYIRSKMRLPGLSSLQQRVMSLNDDDETDNNNVFKSLNDLPVGQNIDENEDFSGRKNKNSLIKSHSFKSTKKNKSTNDNDDGIKKTTAEFLIKEKKEAANRVSVSKAASLDSVKNLDEQRVHLSEMKLELKRTNNKSLMKPIKTENNNTNQNGNHSSDDVFNDSSSIVTIYGPSHTAIVNVTNTTSNKEDFTRKSNQSIIETGTIIDGAQTVSIIKEHQVSITKIQVKQETSQEQITKEMVGSTILPTNNLVPEFINKSLNKVETRPASNIILSMKSPKIIEEQSRPKTLVFNFEDVPNVKPMMMMRKFSKENLEIVEKATQNNEEETQSVSPPSTAVVTLQSPRFIKSDNKNTRKSSIVSITTTNDPLSSSIATAKEKRAFKSRSTSLDSLKSEYSNNKSDNEKSSSSEDSLDKIDNKKDTALTNNDNNTMDTVVLRKKSIATIKKKDDVVDEPPELMKVFARRSLKVKDSDIEALHDHLNLNATTKDSDKENQIIDSSTNNVDNVIINNNKKKVEKVIDIKTAASTTTMKEPLTENKTASGDTTTTRIKSNTIIGSPPVEMLRRSLNQQNNIFLNQQQQERGVSLNQNVRTTTTVSHAADNNMLLVKKQSSFCERRKWMMMTSSSMNKSQSIIINDDVNELNKIKENIKNAANRDDDKNNGGGDVIDDHDDNRIISTMKNADDNDGDNNTSSGNILLLTEPKNFNQRKAEWEKRAQLAAQKKNTP